MLQAFITVGRPWVVPPVLQVALNNYRVTRLENLSSGGKYLHCFIRKLNKSSVNDYIVLVKVDLFSGRQYHGYCVFST